jgi:hypothetical protein
VLIHSTAARAHTMLLHLLMYLPPGRNDKRER